MTNLPILIAGAGIGGLTAALSLQAAGLSNVQVFEAAPTVSTQGVGINLPPHAVRELEELGLGQALAALGPETAELAYYDPQGRRLWTEPRGRQAGYAWSQYSVHRGKLQRLLLDAVIERLGVSAVMTGQRVVGADQQLDGTVRVTLEGADGGRHQVAGRMLIAADGIRSAVRHLLYPDEAPLPWNGWVMFRGATEARPFLTGQSMVIIGDEEQRVVAYPISPPDPQTGKVLTNWILTRRSATLPNGGDSTLGDWNRPVDPKTLQQHVDGWRYDWLDAAELIAASAAAFEYPMVDVEPLPRWTFGCITLLGDSAHAMYPFGSNGASQAILDARILAWHLATTPDQATALQAYEDERRPVTRSVQLANRNQAANVMKRVSELARQHALAEAAGELLKAEAEYKRLAGFDPDQLKARRSYSVRSS